MPHPPNANLDTCVHEGGLTSHSFQAWVSYIVTPKKGVINRRGIGLLCVRLSVCLSACLSV